MADMHLASLQREHETNLASKMKVASRADFAPMQKEGFQNSKWAGFLKPTGYKPMIVLFWLFLIQQFSGIYITLFFAVTFFQVNTHPFLFLNPKRLWTIMMRNVIGSGNRHQRIPCIDICWRYSIRNVSDECMAVEAI